MKELEITVRKISNGYVVRFKDKRQRKPDIQEKFTEKAKDTFKDIEFAISNVFED